RLRPRGPRAAPGSRRSPRQPHRLAGGRCGAHHPDGRGGPRGHPEAGDGSVNALTSLLDVIARILFALAAAMITVMVGVVLLQVFLRYVLNNPTSWSEEVATLAFVWCVMLVIPLGIRHQEHISMEFLVSRLAGARWAWAQILLNVVVGATLVAIG